jgi:hypothetical protein
MEYLGSVLNSDGSSDQEVSRRIGKAKGDFDALAKAWSHSSLTRPKKLRLFKTLIEA